MVNIFVHNMAIHDDKHSPKSIQICPSTFKIVPKTKQTLKVLQTIKFFCPNGEISQNLATLFIITIAYQTSFSLFLCDLIFSHQP